MRLPSIILLLLLSVCAYGQSSNDARKLRIERLEKEIGILDSQLKANQSKKSDALARLSLLRTKISSREALVRESDLRLAEINGRISSKQKEINRLQAELDTMEVYYERLVMSAFKNRSPKLWYMYVLSSENISQGFRRYAFFRDLSKTMNRRTSEILSARKALDMEKAEIEKEREAARDLRTRQMTELNSLKSEASQLRSLSNQLSRQKTKYQKEIAAKRRQADALEAEIRRAIGTAMASGKSSSKSKAPVDYVLAEKFSSNKGKLPWPVDDGAIVSHFGKQFHSVFKSLQMPLNNGVSLAVPQDSKVKSVFDGTVASISVLPGYHQCILVQHGNYFTLYAKIKSVDVKAGQKVGTGQVLGTVDTIEGETVFHFEIWNEKTQAQNPESWLRPR